MSVSYNTFSIGAELKHCGYINFTRSTTPNSLQALSQLVNEFPWEIKLLLQGEYGIPCLKH